MKKRYKSIFTLMLVFIALSYVFDGFTKTQTEREKLPSYVVPIEPFAAAFLSGVIIVEIKEEKND